MIVLMVRIVMAMWMRVAGAIRVLVFVLVEHDLQAPAECIGDPAQRPQACSRREIMDSVIRSRSASCF